MGLIETYRLISRCVHLVLPVNCKMFLTYTTTLSHLICRWFSSSTPSGSCQNNLHSFLRADCRSCHATNSIKAPYETRDFSRRYGADVNGLHICDTVKCYIRNRFTATSQIVSSCDADFSVSRSAGIWRTCIPSCSYQVMPWPPAKLVLLVCCFHYFFGWMFWLRQKIPLAGIPQISVETVKQTH